MQDHPSTLNPSQPQHGIPIHSQAAPWIQTVRERKAASAMDLLTVAVKRVNEMKKEANA